MELTLLVGLPGSKGKVKQIERFKENGFTVLKEGDVLSPSNKTKILDINPWLCLKSILKKNLHLYNLQFPGVRVHVVYCKDDTPDEVPYFTRQLKERYEIPQSLMIRKK